MVRRLQTEKAEMFASIDTARIHCGTFAVFILSKATDLLFV